MPKSVPPIIRNPQEVDPSVRSSLALNFSRGIFFPEDGRTNDGRDDDDYDDDDV